MHKFIFLSIIPSLIFLISCENNVEPVPETFTGFWKAEELSQHFWLDENIDSLSGFGQIAKVNNSGIIEWIPIEVQGNVTGANILLTITYEEFTSNFSGSVINTEKFIGTWEAEGELIPVTYYKRIGR
jgi:hypothetical protein